MILEYEVIVLLVKRMSEVNSNSKKKKNELYSIRVSSSHTNRKGIVMTIIVGETTFLELQKWVHQHKIMLKKEEVDFEFWCGYPPKVIHYPHPTCIVSDYIPSQEHVIVKSKQPSSSTTTTTTTTTTTSGSSRPKRRKAAQEAMDSFKDTIQYQNDILRQETKRTKKSNTSASTTKAKQKNKTTKEAKEKAIAAAHSRRMAKQYPGGMKLGSNDTPTNKKKKQISLGSTKDDLTTTLLSSVVNGGDSKKMVSMVIRKAMKNAVNQQYEINRATVRVASLLSQEKPKFLSTSTGTTMRVQYTKGIQGRGMYEESIDIVTKETLAEVISTVYHDDEESKQMLHSHNMAQLSPRVFWSLLYHYPNYSSTNDILPLLQPNLNWNFLTKGRIITLSEKAQENLRQQQQPKEEDTNIQATKDAIQQVEHAMMTSLSSTPTTNLGQRSAQAAIQRLQQQKQKQQEWSIETPNDVDEDELQQCIKEANNDQKTDKEIISIVSILMNQCQIHNWRELANVDTSSTNNAVLKKFLSNNTVTKINEERLESWIHVAQQYSLEEIMLEILDGNEDVFHLLCTHANAGTPKDLSLWESMPSLLYDTLLGKHCLKKETEKIITTTQLQTWCTRARIALTTYPWLQDFITPIHE